jgi:hypothetical protein
MSGTMIVQAYEPWVGYSPRGARTTIVRFSLHDSDRIAYYEYRSFNARMSRDLKNTRGIPNWSHSVIGGSDRPRVFRPRNPNLTVGGLTTSPLPLCLASWQLQGRVGRFGLTVYTPDGPENFVFYFGVGEWKHLADPYEHGHLDFIDSAKYSTRTPPGMMTSYTEIYSREVQQWNGQ